MDNYITSVDHIHVQIDEEKELFYVLCNQILLDAWTFHSLENNSNGKTRNNIFVYFVMKL